MKISLKFRHLWDEIGKWSSFTILLFYYMQFFKFYFYFWKCYFQIEYMVANRARRGNAGAKMSQLIEETLQEDDFYKSAYGGFAEVRVKFFFFVNSMVIYFSKISSKICFLHNLCPTIWMKKNVLSENVFFWKSCRVFQEEKLGLNIFHDSK